jgi:aminopeptidase N
LFDLVGPSLVRRKAIELDVNGAATAVPQLNDQPLPDLLLINDGDLTYAKVSFDERSLNTLTHHMRDIDDLLARSIAWGAIWDMTRDAELRARDYVGVSINNLDAEVDAPNLSSLLRRVDACVSSFSEPRHRPLVREQLARAARERMERSEPGSDVQLLWANSFIGAARSAPDIKWLRGLLEGTTTVTGLVVDFELRWRVIDTLATIGVAGEDMIRAELERDPTDEGQKSAAAAQAARPDAAAKAAAWEAVVSDESLSVPMKRAISSGFHRVDQLDVV